jgi:hypothetical protein
VLHQDMTFSYVWWYTSIISALERYRQEDSKPAWSTQQVQGQFLILPNKTLSQKKKNDIQQSEKNAMLKMAHMNKIKIKIKLN